MSVGLRGVGLFGLLVVGFASAAEPPASPPRVWLPEGAVARLGSTRLRHGAPAQCVTFSPDGKVLVSGGQDGAVRVWDVATGEQKAFSQKPGQSVAAVRFLRHGTQLAVNHFDGHVRFLDPVTLRERSTFEAPEILDFDISADGSLIATVGLGGLTVSELATNLPRLELPGVRLVAFHPDGKHVAAADANGTVTVYQITGGTGSDGKVKLWEVGKKEPIAEIDDSAGRVSFLGNDRLFAAKALGFGVYDLKEKVWVRTFPDAIGAYALSPDGTRLAATGHDSVRVRIWDLTSGEQLHAADDMVPDATLLHPTADGRGLFVIAADRGFVWRVGETGATPAGKFPGRVTAAAAGGDRLAVATSQGVSIWDDFDPARPLATRPSRTIEAAGNVPALALSSDGKWLAYARGSGQVWLADPTTGKPLRALPGQTTAVGLAFTPKGDRLAVLGSGFVRLWSLVGDDADEKPVWEQRVSRGPQGALAFSPDGKSVAASASPRMLVLGATDKRQLFSCDRQGAGGLYHAAAFTPDGRFLVTGSSGQEGCVEVWDVTTGERIRRYSTGLGSVNRLVIFPDGKRIASAGADDAVTVWDLTIPTRRGDQK